MLRLDGAVGPASADRLIRGIAAAQRDGAAVVVLQIDTPGGLDTSMRDIIKDILASPVPVATFVAPGRRARRQRRHLHPLRQPRRRDGAGHQPRRRHAGGDRRPAATAASRRKPRKDRRARRAGGERRRRRGRPMR
ncbi:MAG: hypothetical protein MZW92_20790 [Comamonadaceae bacterium]|nr:hypothetical protein [Comamonadaceae bacterium]